MLRGHNDNKKNSKPQDDDIPNDQHRKKRYMRVFSAQILTNPASNTNPPMPLDADNALPVIELWFGKESPSEVGLIFHLDTCVAMNTGNLHVYQWLMTTRPYLVAEYIQYDDCKPFQTPMCSK